MAAMISMPPTVGSLVDRGKESYQVPSAVAVRTAIFLLAMVHSLPKSAGSF
jgi:hypothetical protein